MNLIENLSVKIFADVADLACIQEYSQHRYITGFTSNPTLMRQSGIKDYEGFVRDLVRLVPDKPLNVEVFSDQLDEMYDQAHLLSSMGENIYIKIPVTNSRQQMTASLVKALSHDGIKLNVTAVMTPEQIDAMIDALCDVKSAFISVFAGRIADTGRDPLPLMLSAVNKMKGTPQINLLWASPREILNIFHAEQVGCHVITLTKDILKKLYLIGKSLEDYSLETVKMFREDALKAGYTLGGESNRFDQASSQSSILAG